MSQKEKSRDVKAFLRELHSFTCWSNERRDLFFKNWDMRDEKMVAAFAAASAPLSLVHGLLTQWHLLRSSELFLKLCEKNKYPHGTTKIQYPLCIVIALTGNDFLMGTKLPFWVYKMIVKNTSIEMEYREMQSSSTLYHSKDELWEDANADNFIDRFYNNFTHNMQPNRFAEEYGRLFLRQPPRSITPDTPVWFWQNQDPTMRPWSSRYRNLTCYFISKDTQSLNVRPGYEQSSVMLKFISDNHVKRTEYRCGFVDVWHVSDWPHQREPRRLALKEIKVHRSRLLLQTVMLGMVGLLLPPYIYVEIASHIPGIDSIWFTLYSQVEMINSFLAAHKKRRAGKTQLK